jgi:hypothetical protein
MDYSNSLNALRKREIVENGLITSWSKNAMLFMGIPNSKYHDSKTPLLQASSKDMMNHYQYSLFWESKAERAMKPLNGAVE